MSDLSAAVNGDERAFGRVVAPYRRELLVHAYRLLGSSSDAEDALQEALLAAWRGVGGLRSPDSLRPWLYQVTTRAGLRLADRRGPRMLSWDSYPSADPTDQLAGPAAGPWVEPFLDPDPAHAAERREHIELAWIAAMQRLPANQRAALVLRDVLSFSATQVADMLDTSAASVNSALQRARATLAAGTPVAPRPVSVADRRAVERFASAFVEGDVAAVVRLLAEDVRFTMPPLPAWFCGVENVSRFLATRVFATRWRVETLGDVNGHPALLGSQWQENEYRAAAVMVLHASAGRIEWVATFIEPELIGQWANHISTVREPII